MSRLSMAIGALATIAAVGLLSGGPAGGATPTGPTAGPARGEARQAAAPNTITATFNRFCATYGFDVTNTTALAHIVTLTVGGTAQPPVTVAAGATAHVALAVATPPDSHVVLSDSDGTVLGDVTVRFCTDVVNHSVTIKANTSYTLGNLLSAELIAPTPTHGTVVPINRAGSTAIRYTPDPCFAGTDMFGYTDFIASAQGVVTVRVLPGACGISVRRSATNCAARAVAYTAVNPYARAVTLVANGANGPSDVRHFVVPAHTTKAILQFFADPTHASTERFTFSVVDPLITLLTDTVTFPCAAAGSEPQLAATGSAAQHQAGWGAAAVAGGMLLTWLGRRRVRRPRPSST